jgi:hypoxanthine phosphoribosyltransferase
MEKLYLSWEEYTAAVDILVRRIQDRGVPRSFDAIVGVSRGGLVAATLLSHRLGGIPVHAVSVATYDAAHNQVHCPEVTGYVPASGALLIVDDIVDSGTTAAAVFAFVAQRHEGTVDTVAVCVRPKWERRFMAGMVVAEGTWVVFPYEVEVSEEGVKELSPGQRKIVGKMPRVNDGVRGILERSSYAAPEASPTRRWVTVRTDFQGVHCWPECPFEEVSFLKQPHRHVFKVQVDVELPMEQDRQIEFFMLQEAVGRRLRQLYQFSGIADGFDSYTDPFYWSLGSRSCETIAQELIAALRGSPLLEPALAIRVTVSEDGENGATVETKIK